MIITKEYILNKIIHNYHNIKDGIFTTLFIMNLIYDNYEKELITMDDYGTCGC